MDSPLALPAVNSLMGYNVMLAFKTRLHALFQQSECLQTKYRFPVHINSRKGIWQILEIACIFSIFFLLNINLRIWCMDMKCLRRENASPV